MFESYKISLVNIKSNQSSISKTVFQFSLRNFVFCTFSCAIKTVTALYDHICENVRNYMNTRE